MVSFDFECLFTSIPLDECIDLAIKHIIVTLLSNNNNNNDNNKLLFFFFIASTSLDVLGALQYHEKKLKASCISI